ncbi:protein RICE SALT SENSITIVE 3-like isoform X2 [Telopea speciosissima]|uniref:protein RICE SALT SENSITIVE 3-like isoform X2 n=1 Tax=Telopea speciosissima TaxID=54955 RepID=UPI001CC5A0CE|nr:protein RICE SALT SENSITIVE 3-like isoform X2 [Telopea speciosissima]XP_043723816.1 protein RICE SALT SENSITIVE 3-like isoform X2 [Telopea speciosissima]XP_043723817.1 protein RICE SALT SENSITIVE 3-like isoform X2 [Telopea speciosissima]
MKTLNGFMLFSGGSCLEITHHQNGICQEEPMIDQEETGGTVWEDGFCNFAASMAEIDSGDLPSSSVYGNNYEFQHLKGLQPELFFKMSHEIYNYGEGLIGKVAADHSHKWVFKEPSDQETNFLSAWHNQGDSYPRTWEAQFQCGIKTIALIAVREGVVQLGALHKVMEDLNYVVLLRKKFSYLESIPGVLLPHPSSSAFPFKVEGCSSAETWPANVALASPAMTTTEFYNQYGQPIKITPSMSSLEALLSKLPSVVPSPSLSSSGYCESTPQQLLSLHQPSSSSRYCESAPLQLLSSQQPLELMGTQKVAKEEIDEECGQGREISESSCSMSSYYHHYSRHNCYNQQQHYHHDQQPNKEL